MSPSRQRFSEHLEALRTMLVGMAWAWILGCGVVAAHFGSVMELLRAPLKAIPQAQLITLSPLTGLFIGFQIVITGGLIIAAPLMLLHLVKFISPALKPREKQILSTLTGLGIALFGLGVIFGWAWLLPLSLQIAFAIQGAMGFQLLWNAQDYFSFVSTLPLILGGAFCLPLIMGVLLRLGVLPWAPIARRWDAATIVILLTAAAITPTGDPVSFLFIAAPLALLYALAVWLGRPRAANVG